MKLKSITKKLKRFCTANLILALLSGSAARAEAKNVSFACQTINEVPVTMAMEAGKEPRQFIHWLRALGGVPPEQRCKWVSARLNEAYRRGDRYITHGKLNNQPVICTTDRKGNGCKQLLWRLHWQDDDSQTVLDDYLLLGQNNYAGRSLRPNPCDTYIDINAFIQGEQKFAEEVCNVTETTAPFACQVFHGVPVTTVTEAGKEPRQLIRWLRALGGVSVEQRCEQVSARLNEAFRSGDRYVTHGKMNNQPVICTTDRKGNGCKQLLWELDWKEDDPQTVLDDFLLLINNNYSGPPLRQ